MIADRKAATEAWLPVVVAVLCLSASAALADQPADTGSGTAQAADAPASDAPASDKDAAPASTKTDASSAGKPVPPAESPTSDNPPSSAADSQPPPATDQPPAAQSPQDQSAPAQPAEAAKPPEPAEEPKHTEVLQPDQAVPILGKKVHGPDGKDVVGTVIDVLVDESGQPRAAVIDFGGFLGVGSRKIAIDWQLLKFRPGDKEAPLSLSLDRNQIQSAPEYKEPTKPAEVVAPPETAGTPAPPPAPADAKQ